MKFRSAILAASIAATVLTAPASAATLLFTLTGDSTAQFTLPSSPVPSSTAADNFRVDGIDATLDGVDDAYDLAFYIEAASGGFDIVNPITFTQLFLSGPTLFTGSLDAPTFLVGTFDLVEFGTGTGDYTLVISNVPEPASWAMLIAGFGLTGAAMRRRRVMAA